MATYCPSIPEIVPPNHQVGFVWQQTARNLIPYLSARERLPRAVETLQLVGLGKWLDHRPFELSGGQQQRVAIARALAPHPAVILADEPTGELDSATGQQILRLFRQIADEQGTAVLIATHDLAVDAFADEVVHLVDGRVHPPKSE